MQQSPVQPYPVFVVALYLTCELVANVTASKIAVVGDFVFPSGVFIFTLSYTLLDVINHILGPREARRVVLAAFGANALLAGYMTVAIALPPAPFWPDQVAFEQILGATPRISLASLAAFFVSSRFDVTVYAYLAHRAAPWARVLASNTLGIALDTAVFMFLAYSGTDFPVDRLIGNHYAAKLAMTVASIPLIYLARVWYKPWRGSTR